MRQFHKLDKWFKTWYELNGYHFSQECEHWNNQRQYTLPRLQSKKPILNSSVY